MSQRINDYETALAWAHYKQKVLRHLRLLSKQYGRKPPQGLRRHIGESRHWRRVAESGVMP